MATNWNCDGSGPHSAGEVRRYRLGGSGNLHLCRMCWARENNYNRGRRLDVRVPVDAANFPDQLWEAAAVIYDAAGEPVT